jgi:GDP-mannose pyrophosphatase NudK
MAAIDIKEEKVVYKEHGTLTQVRFHKKKNSGEWEEQTRVLFNHGNAVTVLLYNRDHKTVLLTKQFRLATYVNGNPGGLLLETCAGLLEEGEKPEDAIKREVKEETGYEINALQKIAEAYSSPGAYTELVHYFIAPFSRQQKVAAGGGLEEEGEELKVVELPFAEALRQAESGEIKDAKTLFLLYYAKANQLMT